MNLNVNAYMAYLVSGMAYLVKYSTWFIWNLANNVFGFWDVFCCPLCSPTGIFYAVCVIDDKYKPRLSSFGHVMEENLK